MEDIPKNAFKIQMPYAYVCGSIVLQHFTPQTPLNNCKSPKGSKRLKNMSVLLNFSTTVWNLICKIVSRDLWTQNSASLKLNNAFAVLLYC